MAAENDNNIPDIDLGEIDFDLSEDEERWEDLIDQIMAGNVIPVIGPDLQIEDENNFHQQLIRLFASKFGVTSKPETFSQLIYDHNFKNAVKRPEAIYKYIYQVLTKVQKRPSDLLLRLLSTRKFPFVITTSFTPVVESAMRQVWGQDCVRVLQFRNDPNRDLKVDEGDVPNEKSMMKPTVFYMFGKFSEEKNRYVVTDMDMMEFCKAWLAGIKTPRVLTEAIRRRYLLVLGNNYSDWLYRFICFSLNNNMEGMRTMLMVNQHYEDDAPLIQFLHRLETFIQRDPVQVVAEIESRINKREQATGGSHDNATTCKNDVFLSYSRKDEEWVRRLYAMLSAQGLRVWYDRHDIGEGDNWRQAIMAGIHDSRIFVPLLTTNVEQEIMEEHEYRAEWKEAANMAARMGGRTFIVPLAEKGFDFYNQLTDVPTEFQERNATWFDISTDLGQVADVIEQKVNEVKLLEEKMRNKS